MCSSHHLLFITRIVPFLRQTRIVSWHSLVRRLQPLLASLAQFVLQEHGILGIALVYCVRKVTQEWHKTNHKVDGEIHVHLRLDARGQWWINFLASPDDHEGEQEVEDVANGGYEAYDTGPTEAGATKVEKSEIEAVGAALDFGEDSGFILGQARWKGLALLLRDFDAETGCWDGFEVWILLTLFVACGLFEDFLADQLDDRARHVGGWDAGVVSMK